MIIHEGMNAHSADFVSGPAPISICLDSDQIGPPPPTALICKASCICTRLTQAGLGDTPPSLVCAPAQMNFIDSP